MARLDEKHKFWIFDYIFENFLRKFTKMHYFRIFLKEFNKPMHSFFAVWTKKHKLFGIFEKLLKIFDENPIETLNFIIIIGKFVTKNRAIGNNTIFLQQFFRLF